MTGDVSHLILGQHMILAVDLMCSAWPRKLKNFEGDRDENLGLPPQKSSVLVHLFCLWKIVLLFLIFLSFS